jgi:hypothetical protein
MSKISPLCDKNDKNHNFLNLFFPRFCLIFHDFSPRFSPQFFLIFPVAASQWLSRKRERRSTRRLRPRPTPFAAMRGSTALIVLLGALAVPRVAGDCQIVNGA